MELPKPPDLRRPPQPQPTPRRPLYSHHPHLFNHIGLKTFLELSCDQVIPAGTINLSTGKQ